ncbi:TonB-dependent siderophore receptor [Methylocystis sp. SC2]|uniref:TonB-dependent siderophore receptor n=1 Tax=Methylocystis sp. (strain SC2) TaxID=187303 RepID=UPI00027AE783|nr:TonB-dependent siderophore receptor [Methylocystis sp. SC2]CCJ07913.1 TonB-dependent siderophore receptor [Methylocystis sp. SC2]
MLPAFLSRGVSAGALTLALSSLAHAQQSLPTIDVGGQRRPTPTPRGAPAPGPGSSNADAAAVRTRFATEPKTPTQGYVVREASTATKVDIPIRELPVSIQVIPKQVLKDQNITQVQDALENVSGVTSNSNDDAGYNFNIRGFQSLNIYRNNLRTEAFAFDTANIERIEVLKGPASVLYGRAEPGGLINLITKEPLAQPRYVIEQQVGNYNWYRTQWDVSAPVQQAEGLAYRVTGAYQNWGSFRNFRNGSQKFFIAPVVSYRPTEWTDFTADAQFQTQSTAAEVGLPPIGPNLPDIPLNVSLNEPNEPKTRSNQLYVGYRFRQNLNEDWKVTNRFLYSQLRSPANSVLTVACQPFFCIDPTTFQFQRQAAAQSLNNYSFSTNIDIEGKFQALGGNHIFLTGLDYYSGNSSYYAATSYDGFSPANVPFNLVPLNPFAPVYGLVPSSFYQAGVAGSGYKFHLSSVTQQKAFYVQDYVTWFDRLHVLAGVRYDVADQTNGSVFTCCSGDPAFDYSATKEEAIRNRLDARTAIDRAWTPRAGVVFDILPQLNVYGSYSRSFGLNNGLGTNREPLPPQRGQQWEVGLKAEPLPGLTATLAFYQITRSGVPVPTLSSGFGLSVISGLQRSRGVELDVTGAITDRLAIIANYSHIDAKVISDDVVNRLNPFGLLDPAIYGPPSGLLGNHRDNVPRHLGKVFLTYDFGENGLGFRVGGGVTGQSHAWGDIQNTFILPGWARFDAFGSYATLLDGHKLTAQVNLKNINNARYFTGPDNFFNNFTLPVSAFPAKPFTVVGSLRLEW